ncbi:MAG: hypothetical protein QW403_01955 [Candidatus Aenigmatarchaeota archaeon]
MPRKRKRAKIPEEQVFVLENFNRGTIFSREVAYNEEFKHRLIASPTYLAKFVDNSYINDMGDVFYPLLSNFPLSSISLTNFGKVVYLLSPSISNDNRILYATSDTGKVLALSINGVARDLGQPVTLTNNFQTTLILFADNIIFVNPMATSLYRIAENTTGTSWTPISGVNSPRLGETFSVYFYISDKNSSTDENRRIIRVYGTGFSQIGYMDLGSSWDILDIVNNNNKFLVIFAQIKGNKGIQYAFLWDGSYQNRYFHAIKLPGYYVGSVKYMGSFLIFLQVGADLKVYELYSYSLRYIDSFPSVMVPTMLLPKQRFSIWGNYIAFPVKIYDLNLNGFLMYNILEKEVIFIRGGSNEIKGLLLSSDLGGNIRCFFTDTSDNTVYHTLLVPLGSLDSYLQQNGLSTFDTQENLLYVSNKIVFYNRISIDKVEIFYGNKPPDNNSSIRLEINGLDERNNTTEQVSLIIGQNHQNNYAFFDQIGVKGNKFIVKVYSASNGSFKTNLKRIVFYYSLLM